jgi:hypothetical protein
MSPQHFHGCTRVLSTTRCNSNVLLLLYGIGSTRAGRYARLICTEWDARYYLCNVAADYRLGSQATRRRALSTIAALCLRRYGALARKASVKRKLANHTTSSWSPDASGLPTRDARLGITE